MYYSSLRKFYIFFSLVLTWYTQCVILCNFHHMNTRMRKRESKYFNSNIRDMVKQKKKLDLRIQILRMLRLSDEIQKITS